MCGITGFYALGGKHSPQHSRSEMHVIGKAMRDSMAHRGPDAGDIWQDADMPLLLAHRRLSILDLTDEGAQPMHSHSERYVIVYNGEVYNHLELRRELAEAAPAFRGRSDTETILAAIEAWGLNRTLQKLNGMFAFALWDRKERMLHFARDRLGKKPLYIGWAGQSLVFGSELKSFATHPAFKKVINRAALAQMIGRGYVSAPLSIYEHVWHLPPGQRLSLSLHDLKAGSDLSADMIAYWDAKALAKISKDNPFTGGEDEALEAFEALLGQCVSDRLISDVPLGAFLSGGIDSSTITALMQNMSGTPVKTYSIGFREAGFDEAGYAKQIAAHLGTDHHELYVSAADALQVVGDLPDIYDEPFGDISSIPTYLVSKFARESVTVALSGDGGDEMLGGYARHVEGPKIDRIPAFARQILGKGIQTLPPALWDKLNPKHPQFGRRMHKAATMLSHDSNAAMYERILESWRDHPVMGAFVDSAFVEQAGFGFAESMMLSDTLGYLPHDILTKVDRASMAVSLEARAPLLDYRVFEFCTRLSLSLKIRDGKGKYLLRKLLNRHVPDHLFERPKQGFNIPVGDWLRDDLRDWAEDLLDAKTLLEQGYLDGDTVHKAWQAHLKGEGNTAQGLWHVLMFQAWHRKWIEG